MKAQRNKYELTHTDGHKTTVIANSYRSVQRAVKTFCVDAVQMQRIYGTGKRGSIKNI